jgi:GxxExxY protein
MLINEITEKIIGAAIEVHRALGPGLLESAYEECLAKEFELIGLMFERQRPVPIEFKGLKIDCCYRIDFLVESSVVVELKSVEVVAPIFTAQVLTYLRLLNKHVGLLINFNVPVLKDGLKRIVNNYQDETSAPSATLR